MKQLGEFGDHGIRSGQVICKYTKRKLRNMIPGIRLEYYISNQSKRIAVDGFTKMFLKLASEKTNEEDSDICVLKKAEKGDKNL